MFLARCIAYRVPAMRHDLGHTLAEELCARTPRVALRFISIQFCLEKRRCDRWHCTLLTLQSRVAFGGLGAYLEDFFICISGTLIEHSMNTRKEITT